MKIVDTIRIVTCFALMALVAIPAAFARTDLTGAQQAITDGRFQEAIDLLTAAQEEDARNHEIYLLLGKAYRGLGDLENAESAYRQAVKYKGKDPRTRVGLAEVLMAQEEYEEARAVLDTGLKKAKDDEDKAKYNDAIGRLLTATGKCNEAQQYLLTATIQDEETLDYRLHLGQAYYECQVYTLAKIEYQAVLAEDSSNCMAWYRIGYADFRDRRFNQALEAFSNAYLCDTTFIPVYYDLAWLYYLSARSQRGEKAEEYYNNALYFFEKYRKEWLDSNKVQVAKNISLAYYQLNAYEQAIEELARAIELGVDDPEMLFLLGRSLQVMERYEEAIGRFDQYEASLGQADTASAELYSRRGLCRYMMTRDDSILANDPQWLMLAVEDFKKAIERDSTDARSISLAGTLLNGSVLKRYEDAKWYFDRLTEMFPDEARYWYNAALPRLRLKQDVEALDFLLRAIATDTTVEGAVRKSAREIASPILLKAGQFAKARGFYEKMIAEEPNNCEHKKLYAYIYMAVAIDEPDETKAGAKWAAAIPHLKRAYNCMADKQLNPCETKMFEVTKWLAQAYMLQSASDRDSARPLIEQGLKCRPDDRDLKELERVISEGEELEYTPGMKTGGR